MSGFDYLKAQQTASRLIARFGAPLSLSVTTPGAYDPDTGLAGGTTQAWSPQAVRMDYSADEIDGTNIKRGDQRIYMQHIAGMSIPPGAKLTIGAEQWMVIESRPLAPAGVVVFHDVQVRK